MNSSMFNMYGWFGLATNFISASMTRFFPCTSYSVIPLLRPLLLNYAYLAFAIFSHNHQLECGHGACIISCCTHLIPFFPSSASWMHNLPSHHRAMNQKVHNLQTHRFLCYCVLQWNTLHDQSRLDD
jgi:hypothetical protein